jgi:hypothetical protein
VEDSYHECPPAPSPRGNIWAESGVTKLGAIPPTTGTTGNVAFVWGVAYVSDRAGCGPLSIAVS